jgi:YihY family inner membrane protein
LIGGLRGAPGSRRARTKRWLGAFWHRAYVENITGLSGMVAYNLALAVFPFALLVLFVFGKLIQSQSIEDTVIRDLQGLFPAVEQDSLARALERIRESSTTIGIAAAAGAIWIGASFWGAMDTAFCRIYHVECRGWVEQKRFALVMLLAVTLFLAASIVIPIAESAAVRGTADLPFGLDSVGAVRSLVVLGAALTITFAIFCTIYYFVPKGHIPWHGVWPGALFVTIAIGIGNAVFPVYLTEISDLDRIGGALGFILVALLWFYLVSLAILAGAVINALRHELRDTGEIDAPGYSSEEIAARAETTEHPSV